MTSLGSRAKINTSQCGTFCVWRGSIPCASFDARPSSSMAEQRTFNPQVRGSSPRGVTRVYLGTLGIHRGGAGHCDLPLLFCHRFNHRHRRSTRSEEVSPPTTVLGWHFVPDPTSPSEMRPRPHAPMRNPESATRIIAKAITQTIVNDLRFRYVYLWSTKPIPRHRMCRCTPML